MDGLGPNTFNPFYKKKAGVTRKPEGTAQAQLTDFHPIWISYKGKDRLALGKQGLLSIEVTFQAPRHSLFPWLPSGNKGVGPTLR